MLCGPCTYKAILDMTKFRTIESPKILRHKNSVNVMDHRQSTMPVPEFIFLTALEDDDETLSWFEDDDYPGTPADIRECSFSSLQTQRSRNDATVAAVCSYSKVNSWSFDWETRNKIVSALPMTNTTSRLLLTNVSIPVRQSASEGKLDVSLPRLGRIRPKDRSLSPEAPSSSGKLRSCPPILQRSTLRSGSGRTKMCRPPKPPVRQLSKESHASACSSY
jgi:hypothetical protein